MALAWAVDMSSVYMSRNKAIKVPFALRTRYKRVDRKVLLDSGTTKNFIHPRAVRQLELRTNKLQQPHDVQNVDRTVNKGRQIEKTTTLCINHEGRTTSHRFFIMDIGPDDFIFGYLFLEAASLKVNWTIGWLPGTVTVSAEDVEQWKIRPRGTKTR